jgi:FkbM family methyltransferase
MGASCVAARAGAKDGRDQSTAATVAIHPPQEQEEKLVREFFGGDDSGYYVELGAHHPMEGSQTWHLEQLGWTGVLVEPQPDLAASLVTMRRSSAVFPVACTSPENAGRTMSLHVDGARSSLDRGRMAPGSKAAHVIAVQTRTLDSILDEAQAPQPIDLLSIDVEGHELEVLSGFNFQRWQPLLILVEDHVADLQKHFFLKARGYRLIRRLGNNGWYVSPEANAKISLSDRFEILRKYYLALPCRVLRNWGRWIHVLYADWRAGR